MWKWNPPQGGELTPSRDGTHPTLQYEPWKVHTDARNIAFNNNAFINWYNQIIGATQLFIILQILLNKHANKIWFEMSKDHTYVCPRLINLVKFHAATLPFYLIEDAFDKDVCS